jgi:hypothetical protein
VESARGREEGGEEGGGEARVAEQAEELVQKVGECPRHQNGTIIAKRPIPFSPPSVRLQRRRSQGGNK